MTDQQLTQLFQKLPPQQMPAKLNRRIVRRVLTEVRALASGYVEPVTREIVIVPSQSDPMYAQWIAEGSPSCGCDWTGDYEVLPADQRDDYIGD